jgi:hypothetical protein
MNQEKPIAYQGRMEKCSICSKMYFTCNYPDSEPVCSSIECLRIHNSKSNNHTLDQFYSHQSEQIRQRNQQINEESKRIAQVREQEKQDRLMREKKDCKALYDKILNNHKELSSEQYPLVSLTAYHKTPIVPLPEHRRQNYLNHIRQLLKSLQAEVSTIIENEEKIPDTGETMNTKIFEKICATCAGRCCTQAMDIAYLSISTFRRYMRDNPLLDFEQVYKLYENKIPAQAYEGSCINHTQTGCQLPREMRSNTCNDFHCNALQTLQEHTQIQPDTQGVVVVQPKLPSEDDYQATWSIISN